MYLHLYMKVGAKTYSAGQPISNYYISIANYSYYLPEENELTGFLVFGNILNVFIGLVFDTLSDNLKIHLFRMTRNYFNKRTYSKTNNAHSKKSLAKYR